MTAMLKIYPDFVYQLNGSCFFDSVAIFVKLEFKTCIELTFLLIKCVTVLLHYYLFPQRIKIYVTKIIQPSKSSSQLIYNSQTIYES